MTKRKIDVCYNDRVDVDVYPDEEGEIELAIYDKVREEESAVFFATPQQADAVAVALIQASLGEGLDAQDVQYFSSESPESRLKIGLALIRSAK